QSIEAGKSAERGTAIDVEISDGKGKEMKTVPFLIGKNIDEAKAEILAAGFKVGNINYEESTEYEKNKVTGQQYIGGTELEEGSAINILVSKGTPSSSGNSQGSGDSSDGESGTNSGEQQ
ncbi:MAG: PASTA domain-containing protein, partial [Firmicutes bacterium]|nr:PASTA domain-containing protein [Bacillota bacterium]